MSLTALGPGLTTQYGPFKTYKSETPKFRKTPWKGGGISGGGTLHAGNANWFNLMNPKVIRAVPYPLKPSQYATLVGPAQPSTYFRKSNMGRQKSEGLVSGRTSINQGVQNPGQGNQGGRQVQGEPAVQNEEGQEDQDDDLRRNVRDPTMQEPTPAPDSPMEMGFPANHHFQNTYNTTQEIVAPLIQPEYASLEQTSVGQSGVATNEYHHFQPSVVITQQPIYEAPVVDQSNTVLALNHRISSLNDEISQLRNEHQEMIGFAGVAVHQGARENENLRRDALTKINELENEIAIANAQLEEQGTSFANAQAATSASLAQQAQDIATFMTGEVDLAHARGQFESFSSGRRARTSHPERSLNRGFLSQHLPTYEESNLRRRAINSQIVERTTQTYRERAMQSQSPAQALRNRAQASRSSTQRARNKANATRPGHANFNGNSI